MDLIFDPRRPGMVDDGRPFAIPWPSLWRVPCPGETVSVPPDDRSFTVRTVVWDLYRGEIRVMVTE